MMDEILRSGFEELGLELSDEMLAKFNAYHSMLEEKNRVMNLTAITGAEDTARLHFLDCAALLKYALMKGRDVIDVGSGAGFPGIPLLIACPEIKKMTLMDSQSKRVDFMRDCCAGLGLLQAEPTQMRAEEAQELREGYDFAVARAVARLDVLVELMLPLVRVGGKLIAMKGPRGDDELYEAAHAITRLGGGPGRVEGYRIPGTDICHSLIIIEKKRPTPREYPRRFAQIKKAPL